MYDMILTNDQEKDLEISESGIKSNSTKNECPKYK